MKSYALIVLALVVACVSAFAPVAQQRTAFKPLAMSKMEPAQPKDQKAAAIAAFATAITPLVAHADDFEGVTTVVNAVDEGTVIGYALVWSRVLSPLLLVSQSDTELWSSLKSV